MRQIKAQSIQATSPYRWSVKPRNQRSVGQGESIEASHKPRGAVLVISSWFVERTRWTLEILRGFRRSGSRCGSGVTYRQRVLQKQNVEGESGMSISHDCTGPYGVKIHDFDFLVLYGSLLMPALFVSVQLHLSTITGYWLRMSRAKDQSWFIAWDMPHENPWCLFRTHIAYL